jgi:toxin YoeB
MSAPYKILYTKQALKNKVTASETGFSDKTKIILKTLKANPFAGYPQYEKLTGDLTGAYSRRINRQHRVIYEVFKKNVLLKSSACGCIMNR